MNASSFRQLALRVLWIVIFFTIVGLAFERAAFVRGLWLAILWQAAGVLCFLRIGRWLTPPITRRKGWAAAGWVAIKFPLLYTLGWLALRAWQPSALGLVVGLTVPWCVLAMTAISTLLVDTRVTAPSEPRA